MKNEKERKQKQKREAKLPHISYSELKNWCHCPFYHKLVNIDKIKVFEGNEYTAFGTAIHAVCESMLIEKDMANDDAGNIFTEQFRKELQDLGNDELKKELVVSMARQAKLIIPEVYSALDEYFGEYEVVSTEEKLYEPIDGIDDYLFKGFIDLVVKTADGKYHIIDWKTCSWGWNSKKRSDKMILYQLVLYKHYYCKKHDIEPENIEIHFALLKRTAKSNIIELFKVTSGNKRTNNALDLLYRAIKTIKNKVHIKNRLSCTAGYGCELYKTKYCK